MRYLIMGDIHANMEAFEAVLKEAMGLSPDVCLFLGDAVGYGADPDEVVMRLRRLISQFSKFFAVRGNHDKVASGVEEGWSFTEHARKAALWTREHLSPTNRNYLRRLPQGPVGVNPFIQICHGSPMDEDLYILNNFRALNILSYDEHRITFFGHTHVPVVYELLGDHFHVNLPSGDESIFKLHPEGRYLINPGSVGQPRDFNPKASFAVYDDDEETITIKRVSYDIERAADKIVKSNLPGVNAERLFIGR
ncbi:TPA: metallophosphoesterase [Candidatus Poribacteria bacterium]|nr:metallophosphoesterase [Candidatus Poribacteria bacterium]HEX29820.1 metallophosphoesterase [Candidatus Poribacteria bacterium]